jgi:hypothetical protein
VLDILISNEQRETRVVRIEPWAECYELEPGGSVEVKFLGPEGWPLSIELTEIGTNLHGWPGSTMSVTRDGEPVEPTYDS